ncbi:hypothetical protein IV454_04745 [Massilia antarctica]|uniref:Uncharacterized protein n=1 Tax=Massilia antarctica TaxID=2765360 RepID=A0AA48WEG2_9BURK|nr:hypothetical protein [Massilia antarctica]QPI50877.1 hypothetical protein IV454_04745 [Massilia antarctica]
MNTDASPAMRGGDSYAALVQGINERFNALTGPVFETDAAGLFDAYLDSLADQGERQMHHCGCCRAFIERFGGLATVGDDGVPVSAIWDSSGAPAHYQGVAAALQRMVSQAGITKPFLSGEATYGQPLKGGWHHLAIAPARVFPGDGLHDAHQMACARREAFDSVRRALGEYSAPVCATALRLLKGDSLANSEAALGQAQFLVDLHAARDAASGQRQKDNLVYRMVAAAPMGFCHPRSSMIATLLDDIVAGKSFEQAAANWAAKMHPLQYLRPQVAPTAGAIKAAEAAFEKLGAATALERRYATMADILETLWQPRAQVKAPAAGGIFASVKPKQASTPASSMTPPATLMTLDKFRRTVLPSADTIEMAAPAGRSSFLAFTTAVHADARPILQWDREERRNPVAWYLYPSGSLPSEFNLSGSFYEVTAITLLPCAWAGGQYPQHGERLIFVLKGARDLGKDTGSGLFPSFIQGALHGFRSTIEAYSQANSLAGFGDDNVAGLGLAKGDQYQVRVRVTSNGQASEYQLDRWD